jgi:hypothetical protein
METNRVKEKPHVKKRGAGEGAKSLLFRSVTMQASAKFCTRQCFERATLELRF